MVSAHVSHTSDPLCPFTLRRVLHAVLPRAMPAAGRRRSLPFDFGFHSGNSPPSCARKETDVPPLWHVGGTRSLLRSRPNCKVSRVLFDRLNCVYPLSLFAKKKRCNTTVTVFAILSLRIGASHRFNGSRPSQTLRCARVAAVRPRGGSYGTRRGSSSLCSRGSSCLVC